MHFVCNFGVMHRGFVCSGCCNCIIWEYGIVSSSPDTPICTRIYGALFLNWILELAQNKCVLNCGLVASKANSVFSFSTVGLQADPLFCVAFQGPEGGMVKCHSMVFC